MKAKKKLTLMATILFVAILTIPQFLGANNVQVESISMTDQNTTNHYANIQFDISWDNCWRTSTGPSNWDAAWVFAKWKLTSETDWANCTLSSTDAHHTAPTGSTIDAVSDGKGVFIYRSSDGSGPVDWNSVKLRWLYGTDGVSDDATVDLKVFAIEMVYVPEGTLHLNTEESLNMLNEFFDDTNYENAITEITSENAIANGNIRWKKDSTDGGMGNDNGTSYGSDALGTSYPKGYGHFYCMKYEISQGQYADFLNTLTSTQASNRYPNYNGQNRHTISESGGTYSALRPNRACNYLSWADGCAYTDWASLRPITELEYEKACRGDQAVVIDEFPWGTTNITAATTISGDEDGTETITTTGANACYDYQTFTGGDGGIGPLRCGIFAKSGTTREQAGAGYYGIIELAGNLSEKCVTVAKQAHDFGPLTNAGLFDGSNGDGALTTDGFATGNSNWPGYVEADGKVSGALGSGKRGQSYSCPGYRLRTSSRNYAESWWAGRDSENVRAGRTP